MAVLGLNIPTDIRWERVCVTEDMLDPHGCDDNTPPKWHTSMALFRYIPEDEYQLYPGRRIIYYKLSCTITSYQPEDREIEGAIDWGRLRPDQIRDFQDRLKSYHPCHGAIIQVTLAPEVETPLENYPYFLDFQPKQRALYEQATDARESVSRSLESLNVRKGAGTTESIEVLDIDQGFSVGVQAQYAGTGGGFNLSRSGQWGTKELSQEEHTNIRTTDSSRETREGTSHTTQITQMYNMLQSYHLGTNRAMFYIAPRPHLKEQESGFIRGPRIIDGVQDLFLVVSQPKGQGEPCLSIRLDTSHLVDITTEDFVRNSVLMPSDGPLVIGPVQPPAKDDRGVVSVPSDNPRYECFEREERKSAPPYSAPPGFHIENVVTDYNILPPEERNGQIRASRSADNRTVTISGWAKGHACYPKPGASAGDTGANLGRGILGFFTLGFSEVVIAAAQAATGGGGGLLERTQAREGYAKRQYRIDLISDEKVKQPVQHILMVTSRGLCCCAREHVEPRPPRLVAMEDLGSALAAVPWERITPYGSAPTESIDGREQIAYNVNRESPGPVPNILTARQANILTNIVTEASKRISSSIREPYKQPSLDGAYMMMQLAASASSTFEHQRLMNQPLRESELLTEEQLEKIASALNKDEERLTRHDFLVAPGLVLTEATNIPSSELTRLRLDLLGLPTKANEEQETGEDVEEEGPE